MSDQPKDQNQRKRAVRTRDPQAAGQDRPESKEPAAPGPESAATAALALAVTTAKKSATPPADDRPGADQVAGAPTNVTVAPDRAVAVRRYVIPAAAALAALIGGFAGARFLAGTPVHEQRWAETAAALRQNQEDLTRIAGDVKVLTVALEAAKESSDRIRAEASSGQAELVRTVERAPRELSAKIGQLGAQLDRVESATKDPAAKLAALTERLDRIERQLAALSTARAAAPSPVVAPGSATSAPSDPSTATGSVEQRLRETPVEGWVLHEVYNGIALIESRNRRLIEVGPGETVPGVGRVEAIEKRGKRWVVVTAKGIITSLQ